MPARHPSETPSPYSVLIATIFAILLLLFVYSVADVLLMVFVAALFSLYLIAQDNGAVLSQFGETAHEFFHDARHALGMPCH